MLAALTRRSLLAAAGLAALPARATVQDLAWTDPVRQRTLPLRLRWPDGPGPWPLLLFSHGLGGSREGGEVWGRAWRDAGFVVVHLQHPGSDAAVWAQGLVGLRAAASAAQLVQRVADLHSCSTKCSAARRRPMAIGPGCGSMPLACPATPSAHRPSPPSPAGATRYRPRRWSTRGHVPSWPSARP